MIVSAKPRLPIVHLIVTALLALTFAPVSQAAISCQTQLNMYLEDRVTPGLAQAASGWHCPPGAALPVPRNQTGAASSGYGKHDFQMQLMQGVVGALFQSIFAAPPAHDPYQEQLKQQQELLAKQAQEKKKQESLEKWKQLQEDEAARQVAAEVRKKQQGADLLARMGSSGSGLKPFSWDTPRAEFAPLGGGRFDTSGLNSWQRLLCSSYFSNAALKELGSGNEEGAQFMNRQADLVAAGGMADVACAFPDVPHPPEPSILENQSTKMAKVLEVVQSLVKDLQGIEKNLVEAKQRKGEAQVRLRGAELRIAELKGRLVDPAIPDEADSGSDLLLQQALAELNAAQEQLAGTETAEREYEAIKEKTLDEMRRLQKQAAVP